MLKSNNYCKEIIVIFALPPLERTQPSIDLISKIAIDKPRKIIDIGCGPGNSTQILNERWSSCDILGIDNSESMISRAQSDFPDQKWQLFDAETDTFQDTYDVVYSNATIQWIHNHGLLLKKLSDIVNSGGVLAIQVPLFFSMAIGKSLRRIAQDKRWAHNTKDVDGLFTMLNYFDYYDILSGLFNKIDLWETHYIHIMDSHSSILDMIRGAGLRPYIDRIENNEEKMQFEKTVLDSITSDYRVQKDGKVLFPFDLFFIGYK
ncbi:MAG TPA: methyltransferase domain-containing protein [Chitinispirillaceae bacterium]|nr:methyltransferase domain-containing protein [Chitinispirillaceae bacterium]